MSKQQQPIKIKRINNPDGTYTIKEVYKDFIPIYGLSCIKLFDSNNNELYCEWYNNKNFTNLTYKHDCKNYSENTCDIYAIHTKLQERSWFSAIVKFDCINERELNIQYFKDNNFENLCCEKSIEYNEDNSYITKRSYTIPYKGWMSIIEHYNANNRYLNGEFYKDNNFCEVGLAEKSEYTQNGFETRYANYVSKNEYGMLSYIENYDDKNRFLGGKYFKNKNYTDLILTINCKYQPNGSYQKFYVYEQPNDDKELSKIENYNELHQKISIKTYFDKNFKEIRRYSKLKHNKDGSYVENMRLNFSQNKREYSVTKSYFNMYGLRIREISKRYENNKLEARYEELLNEDNTYTIIFSNALCIPTLVNIYDKDHNLLSSKPIENNKLIDLIKLYLKQ